MERKRWKTFVLNSTFHAIYLLPAAVLVAGTLSTAHAQSSPLVGERPWGRDNLNLWIARKVVAGPALPEKFPAIKIDRAEAGAIRAEFPQAEYRNAWPGIELLRADKDGRIVLPHGGGTINIAAVATAYHSGEGEQNMTPEWRHPISQQALDAATVAALGIPEERKNLRDHRPHLGSQVKFVLCQEGIDNLLWMDGDFIDARTLESLFPNRANPRDRDTTAVYDCHGPIWHDGPVSLLLEFAWGEFVEAEGPAAPGTTLHLPGALAGLFALQNGGQRGGSFGYDDPSYVVSRFVDTDAEKPGCIGLCGFLPYWRGESTDLELITRNGKIAVTNAWNGNDYVFAALFNGVRAEDAVTFRVKMRPHWARAIIELPGLPGMPNSLDGLTDRFDLKVTFAKFGKLDEMLNYLSRAAQISLGYTDLGERPGVKTLEFPRVYRNATLREMLHDVTEAAGVELTVNPKTFRATLKAR